MTRTIGVFTGNRAEYGLLYPILKAIDEHPALRLHLYVGGEHLSRGTVAEIEADGLPIHRRLAVTPPRTADEAAALMTATSAATLQALQEVFQADPPDLLFVLGDRYEAFAAMLAGFYHRIPLAHLGGGDVTEGGCVDDTLRFLMSDLAHLHFTLSEESAQRLIERGEEPWRVEVSGSPAVDNLLATPLIPKAELCQAVGLDPQRPILLFTQHPIPAEGPATVEHFRQSVAALSALGGDFQVVATEPNGDGYLAELSAIISASRGRDPHIVWRASLGRRHYLSWLAACDAVVGNSSSGLMETPFFKKPSITIGPRQAQRLRAENVLAVDYGTANVHAGIRQAFTDAAFRQRVATCGNPFGETPCAPRICHRLATVPLDETLQRKPWGRGGMTPACMTREA